MVRQWLDNGKTTDDYEILIHTKLQYSCLKYKKGGMTKKCPRDGIAMKGKTRA